MAPSAPAPDSLQGPGFWGGIGNFLTGTPTEQRGRPVQIDGQWRVPKYDANNQFTGYGTLDPNLDRRWNPGKLMEDQERARQKEAERKLKGEYDIRRQQDIDFRNRVQAGNETQSSNTLQVALAGLKQQGDDSQRRHEIEIERLRQLSAATADSNALNRYSLDLNNATQNRALDLKSTELQAHMALQQEDLALRKEQLADLRGSRKLAFIGQAVSSLLA